MEELLQKLSKGSTADRIDAAKALGRLGDPHAIPNLKEVLNGLSAQYEEEIIVPGGWGNYYDTHPTQTIIHDPDRDLREAIEGALRMLGQ